MEEMRSKKQFCLLFFLVAIYGISCSAFTFIFFQMLYKDCDKGWTPGKQTAYKFRANADVEGEDLLHVHSNNPEHIKRVCDVFDECLGYNNNGWLKRSLHTHDSNQADFFQKTKISSQNSIYNSNELNDVTSMTKSLKIFVYETNIGVGLQPARVGSYAVERVFVDHLLKSNFLTKDPSMATHFFIPIRCSSYILAKSSEGDGVKLAKSITSRILEDIQSKYPYWSQTAGADHFYVCAHEVGAEIGATIMKNAIALLNTADYRDPYFTPHKDISLPPSVEPQLENLLLSAKGGATVAGKSRNVLAFFAGDMNSGRIRPHIWNLWYDDPNIKLFKQPLSYAKHADYLKKSKFCLVIRGREAYSSMLSESVYAGCIPVIISDHYHLPLQDTVDWSQISIIIPESHVKRLKSILVSISSQQIENMQKEIELHYKRFVWTKGFPQPHDAFHGVMLQLWRRRHVTNYGSRQL